MSWDRDKERKAGKTWHMGVSVVALIFGVFWCLTALSMGAGFMLIFGLPVVGLLAFRLVMVAKHGNETPKQPPRQAEEPWERQQRPVQEGGCPYCGYRVDEDFDYCPKCGRRLN